MFELCLEVWNSMMEMGHWNYSKLSFRKMHLFQSQKYLSALHIRKLINLLEI